MNARALAQETAGLYFSQLDPFKTSNVNLRNHLTPLLRDLTLKVTEKEVESDLSSRQSARMQGFLAGCLLAVPTNFEKEEDNDDFSDNGLSFSANGSNKQKKLVMNYKFISPVENKLPQISEQDLILKLDLYIRTCQNDKNTQNTAMGLENQKILKVRARLVTKAFVATAGCVRSISITLTKLLNCLTMEVLAVEKLSEDVVKVIRRIVLEYEHGTSFASLAFLSTPEGNAESLLMPLILKYLAYLQKNAQTIIQNCELERFHQTSIDPQMRKLFKTIEFKSIGHLLEVCHEQKNKLSNIRLPPKVSSNANVSPDEKDLKQALKDLHREVITVNGHVLAPFLSKKDLLHLLTQTMNSRSLSTPRSLRNKTPRNKSRRKPPNYIADSPSQTALSPSQELDSSMSEWSSTSDALSTSESESPTTPRKQQRRKRRHSQFHVSAIDILTKRLLIAASRTGNGGDAYFVVRDLFGGEDVEVVPMQPPREQMVRPGTIDILERLASVTIKCHQSFDIYPKDLIGTCSEPLIQFHTTTTETIYLREVLASDYMGGNSSNDDEEDQHEGNTKSMLVVEEKKTDETGWRTISIRPALYEKVEVWNTPS